MGNAGCYAPLRKAVECQVKGRVYWPQLGPTLGLLETLGTLLRMAGESRHGEGPRVAAGQGLA